MFSQEEWERAFGVTWMNQLCVTTSLAIDKSRINKSLGMCFLRYLVIAYSQ